MGEGGKTRMRPRDSEIGGGCGTTVTHASITFFLQTTYYYMLLYTIICYDIYGIYYILSEQSNIFHIYYHANAYLLNYLITENELDYAVTPYVCVATHSLMNLIFKKRNKNHMNKSAKWKCFNIHHNGYKIPSKSEGY